MTKERPISTKEEEFCYHYTNIGSETFEHGTNSAIAAHYAKKSAHVAATRLLKKDKIKAKIAEIHKQNMANNMITPDSVLANLRHDRFMARKAGQYSVARACDELEGKYLAMWTDRHIDDTPIKEDFTPAQVAYIKKAASIPGTPASPVIPGDNGDIVDTWTEPGCPATPLADPSGHEEQADEEMGTDQPKDRDAIYKAGTGLTHAEAVKLGKLLVLPDGDKPAQAGGPPYVD